MPATLTRDRIIATAIEIADRDGFEAATLRRIAGELGVHVTSLYNHVPTREAVTDGIVERLIEEADLPVELAGWEQWVRSFVEGIGEVASRHPGAFAALQRRPVQGPRAAASFEVALAAFAKAGLAAQDAYGAVKATALVALSVGAEKSLASSGAFAETQVDELPPEDFPHLHALADIWSEDDAWSFTLEMLVAGLRAQVRRLKT
jgi:AcrR family transcriptional regulator